MTIPVCPSCKLTVIPKGDGSCPACGSPRIEAQQTQEPEVASQRNTIEPQDADGDDAARLENAGKKEGKWQGFGCLTLLGTLIATLLINQLTHNAVAVRLVILGIPALAVLGYLFAKAGRRGKVILGAAGVFLVVGVAVFLTSRVPKWTVLRSADGKFSVSLPGEPEESIHTFQTPTGPGRLNLFSVLGGPSKDEENYIVSYLTVPGMALDTVTQRRVIEAMRDSYVQKLNGRVISENAATLDGHSATSFVIEGPPGVLQKYRALAWGNRVYDVIITGRKQAFDDAIAQRIFDSFRLER